MSESQSKGSYSFYVNDSFIEQIDNMEGVSRSEAAREALEEWIPQNTDNQ